MLEKLLGAFRNQFACTSIVHLGCGKGRAMAASAYFGFTSITGTDFAKNPAHCFQEKLILYMQAHCMYRF
jgi:predicted RNA methylase